MKLTSYRIILLSALFSFTGLSVFAQQITHGPFISAVNENSARLFVRTSSAASITVNVSSNVGMSNPTAFASATVAEKDTVATVNLTGLNADTEYFYQVVVNGGATSTVQSFKSFPLPGTVSNFHFDFGSCQDFEGNPPINEDVVERISADNPRFFLQCGDWGYPDNTDDFPNDTNFFPINYQNVINSYHRRYSSLQMQELMSHVPIDYVFDDHDYVNDNASRTTASFYWEGNPLTEVTFNPIARTNIIKGYADFFPHYDLVDTSEGIHHSIRYGNVEIFMCDNRSAKSGTLNSLVENNGVYTFDPPTSGHTMLGDDQLQWLLDGLQNSTATWKFVMTGVLFNKGYRDFIADISGNQVLQQYLNIPGYGTGKSLLALAVDTWSGYPDEQDAIIDFCAQNNVKNVVWLSSDSHTSAIDDGTNSGFPELMSGNMQRGNARMAWLLDNLSTVPTMSQDLSIWNGGGQGLGNENYLYAFGRIDVFGDDSLKLSIIDVNNEEIASLIVCEASINCEETSGINNPDLLGNAFILYPNTATNQISIRLNDKTIVDDKTMIGLYAVNGQNLQMVPSKLHLGSDQTFSLEGMAAGRYFIALRTATGNFVKSFQKL
ncbi:MAG: alkaline phosphatase D family protein [Flavobacteriales bacterium]|nr:alkaline phosphatase D family protein [Flavobacteriales bacterium]